MEYLIDSQAQAGDSFYALKKGSGDEPYTRLHIYTIDQ